MGAGSALAKLRRMVARHGAGGLVEWAGDFAFWRAYHARLLYRRIGWNAIRRRSEVHAIIADAQGLRLHLNPDDSGLSMELAIEGVHEPILTELWQDLIRPGMTVVDVGANIGYFALLAARRVGQTGKVIAIEPAPVTARFLRRNAEENLAANTVILECAVGRASGRQPLYVFDKTNWNSLVPRDGAVATIEVEVETLDHLLRHEACIDVVRMDVEGYEGDVIGGMSAVISRHKPFIVMELHASILSAPAVQEVLTLLLGVGYRLRWCYPRRWEEVLWGRPRQAEWTVGRVEELVALKGMEPIAQMTENYSVCFEPPSRDAAVPH